MWFGQCRDKHTWWGWRRKEAEKYTRVKVKERLGEFVRNDDEVKNYNSLSNCCVPDGLLDRVYDDQQQERSNVGAVEAGYLQGDQQGEEVTHGYEMFGLE